MSETPNPLKQYFRIPGLNIRLPSGGRFLPPDAIDFSEDGSISVFPMRASDELLLKNPDALMSGFAIENMLRSCAPAIKMPRLISATDLDVLLLAVRAATYGDEMEFPAKCPECDHHNDFAANLPAMLSMVKPLPDDPSVRLSDEVVVKLRPYNFADTTTLSLATFHETRKVQALDVEDVPEEARTAQLHESMAKLTSLSDKVRSGCILMVITPQGEVVDPTHIAEFMENIPSSWSKKIEEKLNELNDAGVDKNVPMKCQKCSHEWTSSIEFDPASFFG